MVHNFRFSCGVLAVVVAGISLASQTRANVTWNGSAGDSKFETPANWTLPTPFNPVPIAGQEVAPPGKDSTFNITNADYTVVINDERSGQNGTQPLGAMLIGNNEDAGTTTRLQTLIINNSISFTGLERVTNLNPPGQYNTQLRHIRVGIGRNSGDGTPAYTDVFAWGVVKQTAGLVDLMQDRTVVTTAENEQAIGPGTSCCTNRAELLLSSDKTKAAASIWEVGGTASLHVPDEVRVGDNANVIQGIGTAIFRVRGSHHLGTNPINIGDPVNPGTGPPGRYRAISKSGLWDVDFPAAYNGRARYNRMKSITEFVLDTGGVTPIRVTDQLNLASLQPYPAGSAGAGQQAYVQGFLRVKLSEPTSKGTGSEKVMLFRADRMLAEGAQMGGTYVPTSTEYDMGRFFDPDRDGPALSPGVGLVPHRRIWEGDSVIADYAGATYTWKVHYCNCTDDDVVEDAIWMDNLIVTGMPGDLDGNTVVNAADRAALNAAIASPPTHLSLLGAAQNLFDLNADDFVDANDLTTFNTFFLAAGIPGDYNQDNKVNIYDYNVWRDNFGATASLPNDDTPGVGNDDYTRWKNAYGNPPGSGSGALGAGAVPEPGSIVLALGSVVGMLGVCRRRA